MLEPETVSPTSRSRPQTYRPIMADESVLDLKGRGELIASATARADTESEVSTCSSPSSDSRRALRGQKARAAEGATVEKISGAKLGPGNGNAQVAQNHVQDANQWNNCPTRSNVNINAYVRLLDLRIQCSPLSFLFKNVAACFDCALLPSRFLRGKSVTYGRSISSSLHRLLAMQPTPSLFRVVRS